MGGSDVQAGERRGGARGTRGDQGRCMNGRQGTGAREPGADRRVERIARHDDGGEDRRHPVRSRRRRGDGASYGQYVFRSLVLRTIRTRRRRLVTVRVCVVCVGSAVRVPQRLGWVSGVVVIVCHAMTVAGMEMRR